MFCPFYKCRRDSGVRQLSQNHWDSDSDLFNFEDSGEGQGTIRKSTLWQFALTHEDRVKLKILEKQKPHSPSQMLTPFSSTNSKNRQVSIGTQK